MSNNKINIIYLKTYKIDNIYIALMHNEIILKFVGKIIFSHL